MAAIVVMVIQRQARNMVDNNVPSIAVMEKADAFTKEAEGSVEALQHLAVVIPVVVKAKGVADAEKEATKWTERLWANIEDVRMALLQLLRPKKTNDWDLEMWK